MEDDFHHFRVEIFHSEGRVTRVRSESPRHPYSLCPAAGERLNAIIGRPLTERMSDLSATIDARLQCTHQFDLATLAVAAAARGTPERRYDAVVEDVSDGLKRAHLSRDGQRLLDWRIDDKIIMFPSEVASMGIGSGFTEQVARRFDADKAEAVLVLRRAVFISSGRGMTVQLDAMPHARPRGGCWVEQPERAEDAVRMIGSTHDFTGRRDALTRDDNEWLSFAD